MHTYLLFLLYLLTSTYCTGQSTSDGRTLIESSSNRKPRAAGSSSRLALINHRFNRRPRRKNLDVRELKLILGGGFDAKFMSIELPPGNHSEATYVARRDSWRYGELVQQLQNNSLADDLKQLAGGRFEIKPEYVKMVEKWLLRKASCPVRYAWEDIGALFWPRYIRRGDCSTDQGSCSWPSGMHCVPSGTSNITLLRWQCKTPKGKGRKRAYKGPIHKDYKEEEKALHLKCNWVRVPYPITSECMCTC